MYRGQDIGDRNELTQACQRIIRQGTPEAIMAVLPHISILRSPAFLKPLLELLDSGDTARQEAAALALGRLGNPRCVAPLLRVALSEKTLTGKGSRALQTAIVIALGDTGSDEAVKALQQIYALRPKTDPFRRPRRRLAVASLGRLAQQGNRRAEKELMRLLEEKDQATRAQALTELSVSYWHRPHDLPNELLEKILSFAAGEEDEVRKAAHSSLSNLADLGCRRAQSVLKTS